MARMRYVKMYKDGQEMLIEEGRVERKVSEGWKTEEYFEIFEPKEKKSPRKSSKNKISAEATVTSNIEADHVCDDNCNHDEEWDPTSGEEWADSIESVYDETANKED